MEWGRKEARGSSPFPSLEDLCLYFLVGRLEKYSSQSLCLLPTALRGRLLLRLPVADIMKIENDPVFMEGLDPDNAWKNLFESRLVPYYPSFRTSSTNYTTAKEYYFGELLMNVLTSNRSSALYHFPRRSESHLETDIISYMLFGTRVLGGEELMMPGYVKFNSMGIIWVVPDHYKSILPMLSDPKNMIQTFHSVLNFYPNRVDMCNYDKLRDNFEDYKLLLSHVEQIKVCNGDYQNDMFADDIIPLWEAIAGLEYSPLQKVVLSSCVTNLGYLISNMGYVLFKGESLSYSGKNLNKVSGLKHIEILGNDGNGSPYEYGESGCVSSAIKGFIPVIEFQPSLETLVVEFMEDIVRIENINDDRHNQCVRSYDKFGKFYNYLPYFISKSSFKQLCLAKCKIPLNSFKSMITTFLSRPTDNEQRLEFVECDVIDSTNDIISREFPLINQESNTPCICGQFKSLCISISPGFPCDWLFGYQSLKLKHLELHYNHSFSEEELKSFDSYVSSCAETLSCRFTSLGYANNSHDAFKKFLECVPLSEIEIHSPYDQDNSIVSVLTNALLQPHNLISLTRVRLESCSCQDLDIRGFFNALFSLPREQLAILSLEIVTLNDLNQQDILDSWRANSRGQKLKSFRIILEQISVFQNGEDTIVPLKLYELVNIACDFYIE